MPLFDYVGINRNGRRISGRIEGAGQRTVISKLARQGVFPSRIDEVKSRATGAGSSLFPWRKKIAITELAGVIRQMATLVVAGIPLDEVLATISQQSGHSHLHRTFSALRENVLQGDALHQAMKQYPESFPDILVNMVQIGEDSGALDQVLMSLAEYFEDQSQVRSKIKSAFAYPLLMALVGSGVLFFMFAFVIPKITRMFTEMEKALPWSTRALIGISGFFSNWWWLLLLCVLAGAVAVKYYRDTDNGRLQVDRLLLKLPLFGKLTLYAATARLARTLSTLLGSGVPLLKALLISEKLLSNRLMRNAIVAAGDDVKEGGSLSKSLEVSAVFPPVLIQITAAGEKSGQLEQMLMHVAKAHEQKVNMTIASLLSLLEPVMILLMGGVVGFIVLAVLLPIFEASQIF